MDSFKALSHYHKVVLVIYAILVPFLYFSFPEKINFDISRSNGWVVLTIAILTLFSLFLFLLLKGHSFQMTPIPHLSWNIMYAIFFALPEEILFRGILQGSLGEYFSTTVSVMVSSVLFGAAHLINSSATLYPRDWNWRLAGLASLAGIPFGTLFAISGSLIPSTIVHSLCLILFSILRKADHP